MCQQLRECWVLCHCLLHLSIHFPTGVARGNEPFSGPHTGVEPGQPKKLGTMFFKNCLRLLGGRDHTPVVRDGSNLLTIPATDDWQVGGLRLGDAQRFGVLILDADGSALKLDRFLWTLPRLLSVEFNGDPVHAAPPAVRVGGLTVVQNIGLKSAQATAIMISKGCFRLGTSISAHR